jgi:hypothetical protein
VSAGHSSQDAMAAGTEEAGNGDSSGADGGNRGRRAHRVGDDGGAVGLLARAYGDVVEHLRERGSRDPHVDAWGKRGGVQTSLIPAHARDAHNAGEEGATTAWAAKHCSAAWKIRPPPAAISMVDTPSAPMASNFP